MANLGQGVTDSTDVRSTSVNVGTTSVQIAALRNVPQNRRKVIVLRNISANAADIISLNLGISAAVANTGIQLRQGESYIDSDSEGYHCWDRQIQAICATANGVLTVMEW